MNRKKKLIRFYLTQNKNRYNHPKYKSGISVFIIRTGMNKHQHTMRINE